MNALFENYPNLVLKRYDDIQSSDAKSGSEEHKLLLDFGEAILIYISGMLFGEYKKNPEIIKIIEKELYKNSGRNLSLGHFQGFARLLIKELDKSLIHEYYDNTEAFEDAQKFVFVFSVLKESINDGADDNFRHRVDKLMKGRSPKKSGLIDFYDSFIQVRNIFAHPEGKAGKGLDKRKWPLNEDYFELINEPLEDALTEILGNLEILGKYHCIRATDEIFDEQMRAKFYLESNLKEEELELDLTSDQIKSLTSGQRYLLTPDQKIFGQLFYNDIPKVEPSIVKEIQREEKAKQITPHLRQLIRDKLSDDALLDELEYLVLLDTARSAHITEANLFGMIDEIRKELGIKASLGTPEKPGDLFIDKKELKNTLNFNPWWLQYFSLVSSIDDNVAKDEKGRIDRLDKRIEKKRDSLKNLTKRVRKKEMQISDHKKKIRVENRKAKQRFKKLKKSISKAQSEERKNEIEVEIKKREELSNERITSYEQKIVQYDKDLQELKDRLNEEEALIGSEIDELKQQRNIEYFQSTWGRHRYLWEELGQYIDGLLDENLNNEEHVTDEENSDSKLWMSSSNAWQIGNLAHYYWGQIRPTKASLDDLFHIGIWIGRDFKWVPTNIITEKLKNDLSNPSCVLWTSANDDRVEKVDSDYRLREQYNEIIRNFIHSNTQNLENLDLNIRCVDLSHLQSLDDPDQISKKNDDSQAFMPLSHYLKNRDGYESGWIYSKIWNLDNFYNEGKIDFNSIQNFDSQIKTLIGLFSNIISELNEFAMQQGIDREYIHRKEEQFSRYEVKMHDKFGEAIKGGEFSPRKEQVDQWRKYAADTYDMNDYLFDMIYNKFRWKIRS